MTDTSTFSQGGRAKSGSDKNSFTKDVEHKASEMASDASDTASAALEKGKEMVDVAGEKAMHMSKMLSSRIKESPLSAVGIAFGVGIVFALLRK
ncbi:hypothetical protein [Hyphomonas sp.]|uniref:hypothetical protein n=1 Tax=Hyphomonas sp. TaxID=87 RepID=UPI00391D7868